MKSRIQCPDLKKDNAQGSDARAYSGMDHSDNYYLGCSIFQDFANLFI